MMSRNRESSLKQAYARVLDVGFGDGSLDKIAAFIDENVMGYGTAVDEKILSIDGFRELIQQQRQQAVNFEEFRFTSNPVFTRFLNEGRTGVVVDEIELITKINGDTNTLFLRMTMVFEWRDGAWKVVHWHGSKPEHFSEGEDPWHVNEWQKRKADLEKEVAEKTADLLVKNRELEIEAALEKVRSAALAMKQPEDMVEVCRIISDQLEQLNVTDIRNIQTAIIDDQKGTYLNYEYFTPYQTTSILEIETKLHPAVEEFATEITKSKDAFFSKSFEDEALKKWIRYRKETNQNEDPLLEKSEAVHYYFYSIGPGALGISTYAPMKEEDIAVFKRFRNVFELTYRRFIDIEQAIAQAHKAQIELALERIRARTMAMQKSDELAETAKVLFQQFSELGENPDQLSIGIVNEKEQVLEVWLSIQGTLTNKAFTVSIEEPIVINRIYQAWKNKQKTLVIDISGDDLKKYNDLRNSLPEFKAYNRLKSKKSKEKNRRVMYCAFFKNGLLSLATPEPRPDETLRLLERFAAVFDLTYTRFLDLQKAEAQATEAQVEAALERIRNRTLLMKDSGELNEAVAVFFQQFKSLNLLPAEARTYFCHINTQTDIAEVWMTDADGSVMEGSHFILLNQSSSLKKFYEAWRRKKPVNVRNYSGKALQAYLQFVSTLPHVKTDKDYRRLFKSPPKRIVMTDANFLQGCIGIMTFQPLSEEALKILVRFAKVFEFTYTRFLDLKQAEEQAREAQIEAALERVRARSMAMHTSEELPEVANLLFQQIQALDISVWSTAFNIFSRDKSTVTCNVSSEGQLQPAFTLPLTEENSFKEWYEAIENKETFFVQELGGKDLEQHYEYLFTLPGVKDAARPLEENGISLPTYQINHICSFKHGFLLFITYDKVPDAHPVFSRFTSVFEQAYTRFLDLQKAEAQAREARIELALERIRAQAMAMNASSDLLDIVVTMRNEFVALGHEAHYFWHMRWLPEKYEKAMTSGDGTRIGMVMELPRGFHQDERMIEWEQSTKSVGIFTYDAEAAVDYVDRMIQTGNFHQIDPNAPGPDDIRSIGGITFVMARTTHGEIGYSLPGVVANPPAEDLATLVRFAGAFDLAYRRFEDLKEAEAQAREAQIEAALERVRSRTMGMQKSEELEEVIQLIYEQFVHLSIFIEHTGFIMDYKTRDDMYIWLADQNGAPSQVSIPYFDSPHWNSFIEAKQKGTNFFANHFTFEEKNRFYKKLFKYIPGLPEEAKEFYFNCPGLAISTVLLDNVGLYIENFSGTPYSDEENNTLMRFGRVFQQTYTRFLDLQNVEEQNKIIQAENKRKTRELEEARQLQLSMLPKQLPRVPGLQIAAHMQTATEVGGDYYDFHLAKDGTLTTVIGDATGHGMKAGTMVTITKSLFDTFAGDENILDTFGKISGVIKGLNFRRLSMCLMLLKLKGNKLSIASAAMPPALIYRNKNHVVEELFMKGMPLGAMKNFPYTVKESHLEPGDTILLLSDGLPELINGNGQMFGYDQVKTEFQSVGEREPQAIVEHLKNSASQWGNGKAPDDDVTFVVMKRK